MSEAKDAILRLRMPISITYDWSAGPAATAHLEGLLDGRFIGRRCPSCLLVYLPPRNGVCPRCAVDLGDIVDCGPNGTVATFCVVNVPFLGQKVKIPYVHIGMRVEPVWKPRPEWGPTMENVAHFRPSGEPDQPVRDAS